jgi:hypothetical protein
LDNPLANCFAHIEPHHNFVSEVNQKQRIFKVEEQNYSFIEKKLAFRKFQKNVSPMQKFIF